MHFENRCSQNQSLTSLSLENNRQANLIPELKTFPVYGNPRLSELGYEIYMLA
jgi:hypothetical protein